MYSSKQSHKTKTNNQTRNTFIDMLIFSHSLFVLHPIRWQWRYFEVTLMFSSYKAIRSLSNIYTFSTDTSWSQTFQMSKLFAIRSGLMCVDRKSKAVPSSLSSGHMGNNWNWVCILSLLESNITMPPLEMCGVASLLGGASIVSLAGQHTFC